MHLPLNTFLLMLNVEMLQRNGMFPYHMALHSQIMMTGRLIYSNLNMHPDCNLWSHFSFVFLSGSQGKKNDISMSLEFWDAVAPHHHSNSSFRHCSPGVLCNMYPNSLRSQLRVI